MPEQLFFEFVKQFGLPAALMATAIYWLNKANRDAYAKLDEERKARIDEHAARMDQLQRHVDECNADRRRLSAQMVEILGGRLGGGPASVGK